MTRGQIVEAQATCLVLNAPADAALYLMDFECRHCGVEQTAGIRVLLRNVRLSVSRTKLGLQQDSSKPVDQIRVGESFTLTGRRLLGAEDGQTAVLVHGEAVAEGSPGAAAACLTEADAP
jgi:hypothetical protein